MAVSTEYPHAFKPNAHNNESFPPLKSKIVFLDQGFPFLSFIEESNSLVVFKVLLSKEN